jgi:hypothetical protein
MMTTDVRAELRAGPRPLDCAAPESGELIHEWSPSGMFRSEGDRPQLTIDCPEGLAIPAGPKHFRLWHHGAVMMQADAEAFVIGRRLTVYLP